MKLVTIALNSFGLQKTVSAESRSVFHNDLPL